MDVSWQDGSFCYTRPCHGGNVREVLSFEGGLVVATFRAGYAEPAVLDASRRGTMERFIPALEAEIERVKIVERRPERIEGIRLEDAPVIVAGGRGLNGAEGFDLLQELAAELSGAVGASPVRSRLVPTLVADRAHGTHRAPRSLHRRRDFGRRTSYGGLRQREDHRRGQYRCGCRDIQRRAVRYRERLSAIHSRFDLGSEKAQGATS
jgi:hypothetical protein